MPYFILILLAIGVFSKRIDLLVDRGKVAPNNALYLLSTFLASWFGAANILWAFLVIHWPFPVGGLILGVAMSFVVNRTNLAVLIPVKTVLDLTIVFSALYLWISSWPFYRHYKDRRPEPMSIDDLHVLLFPF